MIQAREGLHLHPNGRDERRAFWPHGARSPIRGIIGSPATGVLIWSTSVAERCLPKTGWEYSVTCAIAIGRVDRPIVRVNAAWAYAPCGSAALNEGRYPPGSWGPIELDLTVLNPRIHRGDQILPDPAIVAAAGLEHAPNYHGLAYAVFDDFGLINNMFPQFVFDVTEG